MNWQPAIDRLNETVTAILDDQERTVERVEAWRRFKQSWPAVLVTQDGWVVDGRHRVVAARLDSRVLWGHIVERSGDDWVATGNIVRVL